MTNKAMIIVLAAIIIPFMVGLGYTEFGGYYADNDIYKEDFNEGEYLITVSNIDSYDVKSLALYLENMYFTSFTEQYETVDYYVYFYSYNGTLMDLVVNKNTGEVVINTALG